MESRVNLGTSEERVRKGADKLAKFLNTKQQGRLDGFFTVKAKEKAAPAAKGKGKPDPKAKGTKRKVGPESPYPAGQGADYSYPQGDEKGEGSSGKKPKRK